MPKLIQNVFVKTKPSQFYIDLDNTKIQNSICQEFVWHYMGHGIRYFCSSISKLA